MAEQMSVFGANNRTLSDDFCNVKSTDRMKRLAWVLCFAISLYHSLTLDLQ